MITKICRKCNIEKPGKDFPKGRDSNGLYYICKMCKIAYSKRLYRNKDPITRWVDSTLSDTRNRSKKRGITFNLTKEHLRNLFEQQKHKCIYCESQFDMNGTQKNHRQSPSIDRVDPNDDYLINNTVLACFRCNSIKNDASLTELEQLVQTLARIIGERNETYTRN